MIGCRIVIWGATGSGKTTLARRLGEMLDLPVIELDALHRLTGWQKSKWEDFRFRALIALDANPEQWICDGNHGPLRELVLPRADTVIWLDLPFHVTFPRVVWRTIREARSHTPVSEGSYAGWRRSFFSRDMVFPRAFLQLLQHRRFAAQVADLSRCYPHLDVFRLRSPADVSEFLQCHTPGSGVAS